MRAGLPRNPIFSSALRFDAGGGGTGIELSVTEDFLALLTMPLRKATAGAPFEAAESRVTRTAIGTAFDARVAFHEYQAAEQSLDLRETVERASDASYELAQRLYEAATPREIDLLSEQSMHEQAGLQAMAARPPHPGANRSPAVDVHTGGEYTSERKTTMNTTTTSSPSGSATPASFTLSIDGMSCGHCVQAVTKVLAAVPGVGVRSVAVGRAEITAPDGLSVARAVNALGEAGYAAKVSEASPGTSARAVPGAGCCGGSKANAARGGCCG